MTEAAVRDSFLMQAVHCGRLGSPFMERLLILLAEDLDSSTAVGARVLGWPGDGRGRSDALALRLAGGLHKLVLSGADAGLAAAYPPNVASSAELRKAVWTALARHQGELLAALDHPPQTNEVGRSAALIAAGHLLTDVFGLPLVLSELGASAGLNLLWDHYALDIGARRFGPADPALVLTPRWQGPLPPAGRPKIVARAGVDLAPLTGRQDRLRLLSFVWPDMTERRARIEAALDLAARLDPLVERGSAADWVGRRLAEPLPGRVHLIFHTVAWQYFDPQTRARITAALDLAGERATNAAPLAHLQVEHDGNGSGGLIALKLWPGGVELDLGRADFHGRWVTWRDPLA